MLKQQRSSESPSRRVLSKKRRPPPQLQVECLEARNLLAFSSLVFPGADGNLLYQPDAQGNRIEDFGNVGYQGGLVPLPDTPGGISVPIQVVLQPTDGDQGARIQAAINQVSRLPMDENGYRGAVLLQAGEYPIEGQLQISASGVVLLGEGTDDAGGTRLRATGTSQRPLVQIGGSGSAQRVNGTQHNLIDKYVPVGARSFRVDSTAGLSVGDTVIVHRPSPANWIHDIGMDRLRVPWRPGQADINWDRVITHIEGNQITLDAPLTTALEQQYGGGTIYGYTWSGRIENVGVENLRGFSDFQSSTDEAHSWRFIDMTAVQNAWVHDVVAQYFAYALVNTHSSAKWVTVQDVQCLDPISVITGGRRYPYSIEGQLNLVRNAYARQGRHDFVDNGWAVAGPNVFVDGRADSSHADSGPHRQWTSGTLLDNITVSSSINLKNNGNFGSVGHGWSAANSVVWNSTARSLEIQQPPTAQNWSIGNRGRQTGTGFRESAGVPVEPRSLYYAQLQEQLNYPGADKREYWLGDIDNFTPGDPEDFPYVDPDWFSAIQRAAGSHPVVGFDDLRPDHKWIPFTFTFDLAPGEQVVSASLSLAMRGTGSVREDDRIYLGSLANSYRFDDLGWTPIPTTGTSPRVFDLSGQMDLLQGGQLNVAVQDDVGINWAVLNLQVAPTGGNTAPTSLIRPQFDALAVEPIASEIKQATPLLWATTQKPSQSASMPMHTVVQVQIPANHATAGGETAVRALARMTNVHQVATDLLFADPWRGDIFGAF